MSLVEIPVCYGGEHGPDLDAVARHCRLAAAEIVARHSGAEYHVEAIGFVPGFPYLRGLPPELATPRRETPRPRVPAGSVGIGGAQTGVYPLETPGGWHLIGRTPLVLFHPKAEPPARLRAGDRVQFRPVDAADFERLSVPRPTADEAVPPSPQDTAAFDVMKPGLLTTVQDLGRPEARAAGVPPSGAADDFALRAANLLVGNLEGAAALEITLVAPEIALREDRWVALGGAEFASQPGWRPWLLRAGERLALGECRRGCRAYLAIAGGIATEPVMGSRSTYLPGGFGGWAGRALRAGDAIPLGRPRTPRGGQGYFLSAAILPPYAPDPVARAIRGAQADEFGGALWTREFKVTPRSDRMGLRLAGDPMTRTGGRELASAAVVPGTVQIPPDGQPIVLLADAQTIGGYPQAAQVIAADLPLLAQLRPGGTVRFREVSPEEAQAAAAARERALAVLREALADRFDS